MNHTISPEIQALTNEIRTKAKTDAELMLVLALNAVQASAMIPVSDHLYELKDRLGAFSEWALADLLERQGR